MPCSGISPTSATSVADTCYIFSEGHPELFSTGWGDLRETYEKIKAFCEKLGRTPYIYLTGGDPVLHPDFWPLLELFSRDGTRFCVMGNPFHLTGEVCARMKACGCVKYQLSLDGLEETHDRFRKPGSFRATLEAMELVKGVGMWCAVMSTVSKANMEEIPALIDLVAERGRTFLRWAGIARRARKGLMTRIFLPAEYRDFSRAVLGAFRGQPRQRDDLSAQGSPLGAVLIRKGAVSAGTSDGGFRRAAMRAQSYHDTPNGDVYACRRMESRVGNVRTGRPLRAVAGRKNGCVQAI